MFSVKLLLLAIIPPVAYLLYLLSKDKREPEPAHAIAQAVILGICSTIPAMFAEMFLLRFPLFIGEGLRVAALKSFLVIAPVEEACKLGAILLVMWGNKNFNEENDGIVYVTAGSIGFALFENVFYVMGNGMATGIARAVTSIPLHTFCGVIMGYGVGRARFSKDRAARKRYIVTGFLVATFIHGLYDALAMSGTALALLIAPLVIAIFVVGKTLLDRGKALSEARWDAATGNEKSV